MSQGLERKLGWLVATMLGVLIWDGSQAMLAQAGIGAEYGSRDPHVCTNRTQPRGGAPSAAQAREYVICSTEHAIEDLYLTDDVMVQVDAGRAYKMGEDSSYPTIMVGSPIYPIHGSLKKYQCAKLYRDGSNVGKNCSIYNQPNAKGECYRDTSGGWLCLMIDTKTGDYTATNVAPPGGVRAGVNAATANATVNQAASTTPAVRTAPAAGKATQFPAPDFAGLGDTYELVSFSYDFPSPWLKMTVRLKKNVGQYDSFSAHFLDANGREIEYLRGQPALGEFGRAGDVVETKVGTPNPAGMAKVTKVVFRREAGK